MVALTTTTPSGEAELIGYMTYNAEASLDAMCLQRMAVFPKYLDQHVHPTTESIVQCSRIMLLQGFRCCTTMRLVFLECQGVRHRLIGLDDYAVVAEIWQHTDKIPSDEEDIIRVQDDFGR